MADFQTDFDKAVTYFVGDAIGRAADEIGEKHPGVPRANVVKALSLVVAGGFDLASIETVVGRFEMVDGHPNPFAGEVANG